ncbi:MAG: DUF2157 domain-containing protein [Gammaproteobacteria bacterium]|nr:DUF2157 domain-containing protein [Gammaproteobacteria bacterium]MBL7000718.1 DUF2157 domain-containing protein [Gammaproteobacteria bacterium]
MNKHHHWLAQQIPAWVSAQIISAEQAKNLQQRYPVSDSINLGRLLITGAGAIMIGLGVILLFAYNWAEMGKYVKLAVIFSALAGAHLAALLSMHRHPVLSEGLFVVGTMLMGAAIFLIGQIYHLDSHYPDAFLLWSGGALALAWARPSLSQAFIAIILVLSWHMLEVLDFSTSNHGAFLLIIAGIFPLVWRLHSPLLARYVSIALFITLGLSISIESERLLGISLLASASLLIILNQLLQFQKNIEYREIAQEMAKPAILLLAIISFMLTFQEVLKDFIIIRLEQNLYSVAFWVVVTLSQAGFIWLFIKRQLSLLVILSELILLSVLLPALLLDLQNIQTLGRIHQWLPALFNLLILIGSSWMMFDGARQANRRQLVTGSLLFALLAMARYSDLFDSLLARASVFLLVGVALFVVGNIYQRHKKQVQP